MTTIKSHLGQGVDLSKFTTDLRSSQGSSRCCTKRFGGSSSGERKYGIYTSDGSSFLGSKVSPSICTLCEWCGEKAYKAGEVWIIPEKDYSTCNSICGVPDERCVVRREINHPDGSIKHIQLDVQLVNSDLSGEVPVPLGTSNDDQEAAKAGVFRANVPTHSHWKFKLSSGNKMFNDEGARVKKGTKRGYEHIYYCRRSYQARTLSSFMHGSDGMCGPRDGPQCESCKRFQDYNNISDAISKAEDVEPSITSSNTLKTVELWFKIKTARFKDGRKVEVTDKNGNSNLYHKLSSHELVVDAYKKGKDQRFFFIAPPREAVEKAKDGVPTIGCSATKVAEHNGKSNTLELEVSIHIEQKPEPVIVAEARARAPALWGPVPTVRGGISGDHNEKSSELKFIGGGVGVAKGRDTRSPKSKGCGYTTGSNFGAGGYSKPVRTYTTKSTFPEVDRVKFILQLVNDESDSEREHFAIMVDDQKRAWKIGEIDRLTERKLEKEREKLAMNRKLEREIDDIQAQIEQMSGLYKEPLPHEMWLVP